MNRENWDCYCRSAFNEGLNSYESVECKKCHKYSHNKCYEVNSQESKQQFLCFHCRILLNDPFRDINYTLYPPNCFYIGETLNFDIIFEISDMMFSQIMEKGLTIFAVFSRLIFDDFMYIDFPDSDNKLVPIINGQSLEHFRRCSISLDKFILKGNNKLKLASNKLKFKCIVGIFLGKKYSVKDVAKMIAKLPEQEESITESKKNFEAIRFRDMEVLATFNINDPLTGQMMSFPSRGAKCKHLQCFDMMNFIKFYQNQTDKPWTCPLCKNVIPWNSIRIDYYVWRILKDIKQNYADCLEDITSISFDEQGNWKFTGDFAKEWENSNIETKEKKEKKKKERNEHENDPEEQKVEIPKVNLHKYELSIEENVNSFNMLYDQYKNFSEPSKVNEAISTKLRELNSFKNYSPYKFYDFLDKIMVLGGLGISAITYNGDQALCHKNVDQISEFIYHKKMSSIIPLVFSWAKSFEDLTVLTLLIITKKKTSQPDFALAVELFFCFAWYMNIKKIHLDQVHQQSIYELLGKILQSFGDKLQYTSKNFAELMIIFRKYFPQLYIPTQIPKKFGKDTEKLFKDRVDFLVNMLKKLDISEVLKFLDLVYKPPIEFIQKDDEKHLKYFYYFFGMILKKYDNNISNDEIINHFRSWDKYSKAYTAVQEFKDHSKITNLL